MIVNKNSHFSKKTNSVSAYAKALSHPARIASLSKYSFPTFKRIEKGGFD
jgi:hypothetical protein